MLAVSGFMVMGLVSGLSLANHSNSESFLVAHTLLSHDGGFWEMVTSYLRHNTEVRRVPSSWGPEISASPEPLLCGGQVLGSQQ